MLEKLKKLEVKVLITLRIKSLQLCPTLCDLMDGALQALLSMGFSRQEYWSGLPCSPPGDLPHPGIEPMSLKSSAVAGGFFTTSATWEAPGTTGEAQVIWQIIEQTGWHELSSGSNCFLRSPAKYEWLGGLSICQPRPVAPQHRGRPCY